MLRLSIRLAKPMIRSSTTGAYRMFAVIPPSTNEELTASPYEILEIDREATPEQIKKSYLTLIKKHHPDVAKSDDRLKFKQVQEAYKVLSTPELLEAFLEKERIKGSLILNLEREEQLKNVSTKEELKKELIWFKKEQYKARKRMRLLSYLVGGVFVLFCVWATGGLLQARMDEEDLVEIMDPQTGELQKVDKKEYFKVKRIQYLQEKEEKKKQLTR